MVFLLYQVVHQKNYTIMKKIALILSLVLSSSCLMAQQYSLPDVTLRDLNGQIVSSAQVTQAETSTLLVFWNSTNDRCCENLNALNDAWIEDLQERDIKMVAICADINGSWSQVKPLVYGNGWEFETYIDINGDFLRAMCIGEVPCAMLFDEDQNLLCRYNSGCTASKEFMCESILHHVIDDVTAYK
jgi:hypothetical protein